MSYDSYKTASPHDYLKMYDRQSNEDELRDRDWERKEEQIRQLLSYLIRKEFDMCGMDICSDQYKAELIWAMKNIGDYEESRNMLNDLK